MAGRIVVVEVGFAGSIRTPRRDRTAILAAAAPLIQARPVSNGSNGFSAV